MLALLAQTFISILGQLFLEAGRALIHRFL